MVPVPPSPERAPVTDPSDPRRDSAELLRRPKYIRAAGLRSFMGQDADPASLSAESLPRLDERVRGLLAEFPGSVAFQGLRRTLGVHPESLTRALRRLERDGEIERTDEGYRLTVATARPAITFTSTAPAAAATATSAARGSLTTADPGPSLPTRGPWIHPSSPRWEGAPRVELRLAPDEDPARILGHLAGRWFGEFRWVGSYEEGSRTTLLWVSRQGGELLGLVLSHGLLRIHQQSPSGSKGTARPLAAYELLQHVLSALRAPRAPPEGLRGALPFLLDEGPSRSAPRAS
jgi:hypothetical protein